MKIYLFFVIALISLNVVFIDCQPAANCPLEVDPTVLIRCIQIDIASIIAVVRGSTDLTAFCSLANRYMECFTTYTRGCLGQYVIVLFQINIVK